MDKKINGWSACDAAITDIDIINTTSEPTVVNISIDKNIQCPHCGASYYMEKSRMKTCAYYPPIYKNGVNINPDRNKTTIYCTCMECGKDFSYTD